MPEPEYTVVALGGVIHLDAQHVLFADFEVWGQVKGEGGVPVRVTAQVILIQPALGVHVDALKLDENFLSTPVFGRLKGFGVISASHLEEAVGGSIDAVGIAL
jgi:hypothetical protein